MGPSTKATSVPGSSNKMERSDELIPTAMNILDAATESSNSHSRVGVPDKYKIRGKDVLDQKGLLQTSKSWVQY